MLLAHGMVFGRGTLKTSGSSSNMVLVARSNEGCTNPNCKAKKRSTHLTKDCYWPGGGKEGQFLPNFGQRAKANITMSTPATTTSTSTPTPAPNTSTPAQNDHFILSAWDLDTPGQSGVLIEDDIQHPTIALINKGFQGFQKGKVPTFLDSGASDMMFVLRDVFVKYKLLSSHVGDSAKAKDGGFEIVGEENVNQCYKVGGG